ncbi:MAG: hypothetical protein ACRDTE_17840 [Pseudonocardiaceae bacterium]
MRDIAAGLRLFGRAAMLVARRLRLFVIGVAPALITMVLFGAGFVLLVMQLDELVSWLTPFAPRIPVRPPATVGRGRRCPSMVGGSRQARR